MAFGLLRCALGNRREEGQKKYTLSHCMLVLHFTYQLVKSYLISNARNSNSVRRPHKVSENLKDDLLLEMEGNSEVSVFENHRKSLVQHCERSYTTLIWFIFWVDKTSLKMPKMLNLAIFWKREAFLVKQCYQTGQF